MRAHKTKGRTRSGRLSALDEYVLCRESALIREPGALFVDVGFGETPVTTMESARAFREISTSLRVVGLDTEAHRVEAARRTFEGASFEVGGFERLPNGASLIRVMNVLRGYPIERVSEAHGLIGSALREGGLGIEGTSDPEGELLSAHLLRRRGPDLIREALLFHSTFERGFAPVQFRDWLPRDLRRRVRSGEWIGSLFDRWTDAWKSMRVEEPRESFVRSVRAWAENDPAVDASLADRGFVIWRPAGGVPD